MNTQTTTIGIHIVEEILLVMPLEELEKLFLQKHADLEQTFHTVLRYAQEGTHLEAQKLTLIGLENKFKDVLPVLKALVESIIYHAIFQE